MKVQDVMTTDVATIGPDALLKDAAIELVRRRISGMPVVDADGNVLGVLSETDILAKESGEQKNAGFLRWLVDPADPWVTARFDAVTVSDAMSAPARTIAPDRPIAEAAIAHARRGRQPASRRRRGRHARRCSSAAATSCGPSRAPDEEIRREIEEDVIRRVMWLEPGRCRRDRHARRRHARRARSPPRPTRSCCRRSHARCRASSTSARR